MKAYTSKTATLVQKAEYAWNRLSDACHQHAYQLTPTYSEVRHLVGLVEELASLSENKYKEAC